MEITNIIIEIKEFLITSFNEIDLWFDKDPKVRKYTPEDNGWTIDQILEHIGLTNHFLLILIDKGTKKALANISKLDIEKELKEYIFQRDKLTEIGLHKSFNWIRPEHMEPKSEKTIVEIRQQLKGQLNICLAYLEQLKNGEGILFKTTMSVNDLGKIDVYEYIYFLAQHGKRHITQMLKNETELQTNKNASS